jgi:hypothetical protein
MLLTIQKAQRLLGVFPPKFPQAVFDSHHYDIIRRFMSFQPPIYLHMDSSYRSINTPATPPCPDCFANMTFIFDIKDALLSILPLSIPPVTIRSPHAAARR